MPSPYTSSATTTFAKSGVNTIDSLLNQYELKWSSTFGSAVALTYSFPWINGATAYWQSNYSSSSEPQAAQHFGMNVTQMSAASNALQAWANVANITFTQVSDTATTAGDFRFAFSSAVGIGIWGWCGYPNSYWASGADVWINTAIASQSDWSSGSYNYLSLMHETGHGLGLKHPGNYDSTGTSSSGPYLPTNLDYRTYSIMSYNDLKYLFWDTTLHKTISVYPSAPMVYDIAAIQYLYGANNKYRTGNDTYSFDPLHPFYQSIWDAGGNDTINLANFTTNCTIDLTPGHYSSLLYVNQGTGANLYDGTANLGIAYGCIIENVTAGSGSDYITSNTANNIIDGGAGSDTVVFSGKDANYTITTSGTGFSVKDTVGSDGTDTVIHVEKLQFTDHTLTVVASPGENLLESYRIYKAAFDRTPDYGGLGYWFKSMNNGMSLTSVANEFLHSIEFVAMYGTNPTDTAFVTLLYQHVLGRTPDQAGYDYWLNDLLTDTRPAVLVQFSESTENKADVAGVITNGIIYQEYVG